VASEYRRKPRRRRELCDGQAHDAADSRPWPEAEVILERRRRLVLEVLDALDEPKRVVLIMHDIDGYAVPMVAQTLGIPVNTAYSRLRLARQAFREEVEHRRKHGGSHG
jgi:RNA polymerase sigma-70 factor (ECF subfamily)